MSFFGFDATLHKGQNASGQRVTFTRQDPFANIGSPNDGGEMLNFEDTYDGLGDQLEETGDTFNDDTFGTDAPITRDSVGRDFDFAGKTAEVIREHGANSPNVPEHIGVSISHQTSQTKKPTRSGYEAYQKPEYVPRMEADASIWGKPVAKSIPQQERPDPAAAASSGRRMMSLEEVEAAMRTQVKPTQQQDMEQQSQGLRSMLGLVGSASAPWQPTQHAQILQRHQQVATPDQGLPPSQTQQREQFPQHLQAVPQSQMQLVTPPSPAFNQNIPGATTAAGQTSLTRHATAAQQTVHSRGPSYNGPPITQAQQMMQMTPSEREAYLAEEAKRAKRNHKIFLLSKNNGLMTPQDKNFITRIQLQQLLTATGGVDHEPGSEEQLDEDFYYQVYAQIRGGAMTGRTGPGQQFAQTYLNQTGGSRYGYGRSRHHLRGGDNHVQRMEQQVARAVEAAKARPKNKQLVVEGSLGKIAFSNSKTPRPLLNIKKPEDGAKPTLRKTTLADRKAALRDIEGMYTVLMQMEAHERRMPTPPNEESPPAVIEAHMQWRSRMQELNRRLWNTSKVMEQFGSNAITTHPFVQMLHHSKGKKAIPRVFRHLDEQQRLTMLTLIVIHIDTLNVVRDAYPPADNSALPAHIKEEIDLFCQAVMPPLFTYVNDAPLGIIVGLLGLLLDRSQVQAVVRTKAGVSMLTMLISRAELVRQAMLSTAMAQNSDDWQQWSTLYARLFDTIEPVLPYLFPTDTNIAASDDVHVWQFLAAMGVGASPDQQQRLVLGVKERVMETVSASKALTGQMRERRLGDVNLFMRAIGLDVELLG